MASPQLYCRCCLSGESFNNLCDTTDDKILMYIDSINECFSIKMLEQDDLPQMICKICVGRLKDAQAFRKQIATIQEILSNKGALLEPPITVDIKDEHDDDDKTINTIGYLDADHSASESCDQNLAPKPEATPQKRKRKNEASISKIKQRARTNLPYELDANSLTCPVCKETFPLLRTLTSHMNVHYPNYTCGECARGFVTKERLDRHRVCHEVGEYPCKTCKETFRNRNVLNAHMKVHNTKMPFRCPECSERFINYYMRQKHLMNVHGIDRRLYKCKVCPMAFILSGKLLKHTRSVHLQERNYICQECGEAFYSKFCLDRHMVKHTGAKDFKCSVCGNEYGRKSTLREHMRIHNNDKRFSCTLCGKAFTQKCTLKSHMRTHDKKL